MQNAQRKTPDELMTEYTMNTWPDGKLTKTLNEIAELLNVHRNTVQRWVKSGRLSCTRFGRNSIQFTYDQVVTFIDECEHEIKINYPNRAKGGEQSAFTGKKSAPLGESFMANTLQSNGKAKEIQYRKL
jgi:excisionase family DNA binding protein